MLTIVLKVAVALLVFGVIIFIHELGHFLMARAHGVKVLEFAIGMGPTLLKTVGKKTGTVYALRALPIGGFCSMLGEDEAGGGEIRLKPDQPAPSTDPRALNNKKVWQRLTITAAGAVMNLLLGFVLLIVFFAVFTQPTDDRPAMFAGTQIARLAEESPVYQSGLRPNDTVVSIDGKRVFSNFDISAILQNDEDGVMSMQVRRDGKLVTLPAVQFTMSTDETTNQRYLVYDFSVYGIEKTPLTTVVQAAKMELSVSVLIFRSLGDVLRGRYGLNELSGPVGTVDAIGNAAVDDSGDTLTVDWRNLLFMAIIITVNLGLFNLLPLPALDGGRLVFLAVEGITRKKVPAKLEGMIHAIGFVLLMLLMVVVTFSDIRKLFGS